MNTASALGFQFFYVCLTFQFLHKGYLCTYGPSVKQETLFNQAFHCFLLAWWNNSGHSNLPCVACFTSSIGEQTSIYSTKHPMLPVTRCLSATPRETSRLTMGSKHFCWCNVHDKSASSHSDPFLTFSDPSFRPACYKMIQTTGVGGLTLSPLGHLSLRKQRVSDVSLQRLEVKSCWSTGNLSWTEWQFGLLPIQTHRHADIPWPTKCLYVQSHIFCNGEESSRQSQNCPDALQICWAKLPTACHPQSHWCDTWQHG